MPEGVNSVPLAAAAGRLRAGACPSFAARTEQDYRATVFVLFCLGTALAAAAKGVEAEIFGNLHVEFDAWALFGLFVSQALFDSSVIALRIAVAIGLAVTALLLREWPDLSLNAPPIGLAAGSAMVLLGRLVTSGAQRRNTCFVLALGLLMPLAQQICLLSQRLTTLHAETFDHRAYLVDVSLGFNPDAAFRSADLVAFLPSGFVLVLTYASLTFMMTAVVLWKIRAGDRSWMIAAAAFGLAGIVGTALYHAFPAAGPRFAFPDGIPDSRSLSSAPAFLDPDTVRNAMPSLHAAWAFLILLNARGLPRWFRWGTALFFAITLVATLATGQHYLVDLIVALPVAIATQAVVLKLWRRGGMDLPLWFGVIAAAAWFLLLRDGIDLLLTTPGLTAAAAAATIGGTALAVRRLARAPLLALAPPGQQQEA